MGNSEFFKANLYLNGAAASLTLAWHFWKRGHPQSGSTIYWIVSAIIPRFASSTWTKCSFIGRLKHFWRLVLQGIFLHLMLLLLVPEGSILNESDGRKKEKLQYDGVARSALGCFAPCLETGCRARDPPEQGLGLTLGNTNPFWLDLPLADGLAFAALAKVMEASSRWVPMGRSKRLGTPPFHRRIDCYRQVAVTNIVLMKHRFRHF